MDDILCRICRGELETEGLNTDGIFVRERCSACHGTGFEDKTWPTLSPERAQKALEAAIEAIREAAERTG